MRYRISNQYKRGAIEVITFTKEGKTITVTTPWRYAIFEVESDTKPLIEDYQDIYESLDNVEFVEAVDGDSYYDYEGMTEEEIDEIETWLGDNSFLDLEEDGWLFGDSTWYFEGGVEIEEITE